MKSEQLNVEDIKACVKKLEEHHVKPRVVKNKREVELFNKIDRLLGLKPDWKIGDKYYLAVTSFGNRPYGVDE